MFERLSNLPTPSVSPPPGSRSYSPAPRRPNHIQSGLARPPFNARSSSLSLASSQASSTALLQGATRITNGSTLRQELSPARPAEDPLQVLEQIVGLPRPREDEKDNGEPAGQRPKELVADVTFDGLSLEEFTRMKSPQRDRKRAEIQTLSTQSVAECEYVKQSNG